MNLFTRMAIAALMVPFIQCQAEVSDSESESEVVGTESFPLVASWHLTGATTLTAVSGFAGPDVHTEGNPSAAETGVYAVLSRERSNDPCYVAIGTEDLDTQTIDSVPIIDHCGSGGPTSSTLHADYLDVNAGGSHDHNFVRAVTVCMDSNDDKVKGISVAGLKLNSNGTTALVASITDTRTNCHHWSSWATCPAGQVATAVDVHFAAGNEPKELIGLALHCRAVAP